ncbi:transferase [Lithospermum erythrorhizon]|uniref:glutathione transferase n=1 Tax=Lithospermum erythrorhizon TaxID=34254 RepID=A0AAV3P778_LITER
MAIKFYGVAVSLPGARVLACLYEKNLEFELVKTAYRSQETKKEAFLSINPFGQIPALEDGDLKIFESRAMTQYLAHAYAEKGNQLVSQDHKKMAIISTWMEVESQKFSDVASKLSHELVMGPASGKTINVEVVRENEEKLAKILDVYEVKLKESKYLAGDYFTLADLHHLPVMHYLMNTKVKALFDERPHVSAWRTEILARVAWKKVVELQAPFFASMGAKN